MLSRFVRIQLVIFTIASIVGLLVMAITYMQLQTVLGIKRINVALEMPDTGGLYRFGNVTYRGVQVGQVTDVALTKDGVRASMSLDSSVHIPSDLKAQVRSVSAVGEQYVDLQPRTDSAPYLTDGSVIRVGADAFSAPVGPVLDRASALVGSLPQGSLHDLLEEGHKALNGADFDLGSLVDSAGRLAGDLNGVSDQTRALVEDTAPLLDSQDKSAKTIKVWARSLAGVTQQIVTDDRQVRTLLDEGPGAVREATQLIDQLKLTVPVLLANLTTLGQLTVTYHAGLEQALVLFPPIVAMVTNFQNTRNASGLGIGSFRIGAEDPPACTVGFLPPSAWRPPYDTTTIDMPDDIYCKLPQDSPVAVRGVRNIPCMTKPGKYAPTADICNSDQEYEPIAPRQPVIGPYPRDPSLEKQGVPPDSRWFPDQGLYAPVGEGPAAPGGPRPVPPTSPVISPLNPETLPGSASNSGNVPPIPGGAPPVGQAAPVLGYAQYDPRTGEYVAPDGQLYQQLNLASPAKTWQDMFPK